MATSSFRFVVVANLGQVVALQGPAMATSGNFLASGVAGSPSCVPDCPPSLCFQGICYVAPEASAPMAPPMGPWGPRWPDAGAASAGSPIGYPGFQQPLAFNSNQWAPSAPGYWPVPAFNAAPALPADGYANMVASPKSPAMAESLEAELRVAEERVGSLSSENENLRHQLVKWQDLGSKVRQREQEVEKMLGGQPLAAVSQGTAAAEGSRDHSPPRHPAVAWFLHHEISGVALMCLAGQILFASWMLMSAWNSKQIESTSAVKGS